jgi:hypothetical protein
VGLRAGLDSMENLSPPEFDRSAHIKLLCQLRYPSQGSKLYALEFTSEGTHL